MNKVNATHRWGTMPDGRRVWLRVGRDGKNRYCVYHLGWMIRGGVREAASYYRNVIAGGLTKLEARGMLKLLGDTE